MSDNAERMQDKLEKYIGDMLSPIVEQPINRIAIAYGIEILPDEDADHLRKRLVASVMPDLTYAQKNERRIALGKFFRGRK